MNAVVQMVTIVTIFLGVFLFSSLFEQALAGYLFQGPLDLLQRVAPASWLLVACALVELLMALCLPMMQAENPALLCGITAISGSLYSGGVSQGGVGHLSCFRQRDPGRDQYRCDSGAAGLLRGRYYYRFPGCRKGLEISYRNWLGTPGAIGVMGTLFMITQLDTAPLLSGYSGVGFLVVSLSSP